MRTFNNDCTSTSDVPNNGNADHISSSTMYRANIFTEVFEMTSENMFTSNGYFL